MPGAVDRTRSVITMPAIWRSTDSAMEPAVASASVVSIACWASLLRRNATAEKISSGRTIAATSSHRIVPMEIRPRVLALLSRSLSDTASLTSAERDNARPAAERPAKSAPVSAREDALGPEHARLDGADGDQAAMDEGAGLVGLDRRVAAAHDHRIAETDARGRVVADGDLRQAVERGAGVEQQRVERLPLGRTGAGLAPLGVFFSRRLGRKGGRRRRLLKLRQRDEIVGGEGKNLGAAQLGHVAP